MARWLKPKVGKSQSERGPKRKNDGKNYNQEGENVEGLRIGKHFMAEQYSPYEKKQEM